MSPPTPTGRCTVEIQGLGSLEGLQYPNGVRQFCGVPYASLAKRWTRAALKTSWENGYYDGRFLGSNCPNPGPETDDFNDLVPVPPFAHFNKPCVDEKSALVMNIVLPPAIDDAKWPVFMYVHGGSLLYGGANLAIFDSVALVNHSMNIGKPIVAINFNYRVGLGGFLASAAIKEDMARDGHSGCGNFGFTDQQVAFEWANKYLGDIGGDVENVTAVGESAGGISISNQLLAEKRPKFNRAICMSGLSHSIPAWTMEEHEKLFEAVCQHFDLSYKAADIVDRLRDIPEQVLADATPSIQGVLSGTGNPCLDGWFYAQDPREFHPAPSWLKSFMIGDVYHEGVIFHLNIMNDNYNFFHKVIQEYVGDQSLATRIMQLYDMQPTTPQDELIDRFEHMAGDAVFKIPNYVTARYNSQLKAQGNMFLYHFDQRSRIKGIFEGTAYHAHELLYLFRNLYEDMNPGEREMSDDLAHAWIDFAYGDDPWEKSSQTESFSWKVWGPESRQGLKIEQDDEKIRNYSRFEQILALGEPGVTWKKWFQAIDVIVNKRMSLGKGLPN